MKTAISFPNWVESCKSEARDFFYNNCSELAEAFQPFLFSEYDDLSSFLNLNTELDINVSEMISESISLHYQVTDCAQAGNVIDTVEKQFHETLSPVRDQRYAQDVPQAIKNCACATLENLIKHEAEQLYNEIWPSLREWAQTEKPQPTVDDIATRIQELCG